MKNPFRYSKSSPEVIRLTVMLYIRYPLSLRQVEDILFGRASTFATRRFVYGGIGSVRYSPPKSGSGMFQIARIRIGAGTWMRCLCGSMA